MWPFDEISKLEAEISRLKELDHTHEIAAAQNNAAELAFLRRAVKLYFTYEEMPTGEWNYYVREFYIRRSLQDAENDLTKSRLYISVLESQLGEEATRAAQDICKKLACLCESKVKAIGGQHED